MKELHELLFELTDKYMDEISELHFKNRTPEQEAEYNLIKRVKDDIWKALRNSQGRE